MRSEKKNVRNVLLHFYGRSFLRFQLFLERSKRVLLRTL